MTAVSYHGEFPEDADQIEQYGYVFGRGGKSVDVKEKELVAKFAQNRFFKTADSDKAQVEQGEDEAEKAEVQSLKDWLTAHQVPFHHKAGLTKLRDLREQYQAAQAKAQEA